MLFYQTAFLILDAHFDEFGVLKQLSHHQSYAVTITANDLGAVKVSKDTTHSCCYCEDASVITVKVVPYYQRMCCNQRMTGQIGAPLSSLLCSELFTNVYIQFVCLDNGKINQFIENVCIMNETALLAICKVNKILCLA